MSAVMVLTIGQLFVLIKSDNKITYNHPIISLFYIALVLEHFLRNANLASII